jgi:hypothetical protein
MKRFNRRDRIRIAMYGMHALGIQPTGAKVVELVGGSFSWAGLNGRDGKVFTKTMAELGYVKHMKKMGDIEYRGHRWYRP